MWLLKFTAHGQSSTTILGNRFVPLQMSKKGFWRPPCFDFDCPSLDPLCLQDGEKRLLAFTKRGTSFHSVSYCHFSPTILQDFILINLYNNQTSTDNLCLLYFFYFFYFLQSMFTVSYIPLICISVFTFLFA